MSLFQKSADYDEIPQHPLDRLRPLRENDQLRLRTFVSWPKESVVSSNQLCENGFYYIGCGDKVQCAFCGGILSGWTPSMNVREQHAKHYKNCEFVQNLNNMARDFSKKLNIAETRYSLYSDRLSTFKSWPTSCHQKPSDLALAGLYYTGFGDKCKCYICGYQFDEWEPDDVPKDEHKRWNPNCKLSLI